MVVSLPRSFNRVFSLSLPVLMRIYWNKTKCLHKKRVQFSTALMWHTNMAAVSLFWDTNMWWHMKTRRWICSQCIMVTFSVRLGKCVTSGKRKSCFGNFMAQILGLCVQQKISASCKIGVCIHDGILCLILRNVITQGFTNMVTLPESDEFDCVTCTCIADVDWDGNNEILLGTYGQVRFVLKSRSKCLTVSFCLVGYGLVV